MLRPFLITHPITKTENQFFRNPKIKKFDAISILITHDDGNGKPDSSYSRNFNPYNDYGLRKHSNFKNLENKFKTL